MCSIVVPCMLIRQQQHHEFSVRDAQSGEIPGKATERDAQSGEIPGLRARCSISSTMSSLSEMLSQERFLARQQSEMLNQEKFLARPQSEMLNQERFLPGP